MFSGMASRNPRVLRAMKMQGTPAMSCAFVLNILDYALRTKRSNIIGMRVHQWAVLPDM
jgi:hypothetical protein